MVDKTSAGPNTGHAGPKKEPSVPYRAYRPNTGPTYSLNTGHYRTNTGPTGTSLVLNGVARPILPEPVSYPSVHLATKPNALHMRSPHSRQLDMLVCILLVNEAHQR